MKFTKQVCLVLISALVCATALTGQEITQDRETQNQETQDQETQNRESVQSEEELEIRDEETAEAELEGGLSQFSLWDFLRMFLVLGGVIAAIYGIFFVLKRMGNPGFQGNSLISLISTQNLQGNRALHLVEVGNEVFLVGSSEGGVELVGKIEDRETLDQVRLHRSEMKAGGQTFQRSLRDIFSRGKGAADDISGSESSPGRNPERTSERGENTGASAFFMQKQRERLKNL